MARTGTASGSLKGPVVVRHTIPTNQWTHRVLPAQLFFKVTTKGTQITPPLPGRRHTRSQKCISRDVIVSRVCQRGLRVARPV